MTKAKVFCVGFQKTGTTSMEKALKTLGYTVAGPFGEALPFEELRDTYVRTGLERAGRFDAVQDMPWPLMFHELDAAFPKSKFILTVRAVDGWYESILDHFGPNPSSIQQLTYGEGSPAPAGHEARYRQVYEAHNQAVVDHFRDRPDDLLVMDLARGDGWDQLCPFLGEPIPRTPFFRANTAKERSTVRYRLRARLQRLGLPVGGPRAD